MNLTKQIEVALICVWSVLIVKTYSSHNKLVQQRSVSDEYCPQR